MNPAPASEIEAAILGSILENPAGELPPAISRLIENAPESFDDQRHGEIAKAIRTLRQRGEPVSTISVNPLLKFDGKQSLLMTLPDSAVPVELAEIHAQELWAGFAERRATLAVQQGAANISEAPRHAANIAAHLAANLANIAPDANRVFILPNDHTAISESARNIFSAIATTHTLFVRGGSIAELARKADGCSLELIKPESFRSRLERYGHKLVAWKVDDAGGRVMKPKRCSEDNARALLATVEAREVLPTIRTVAAAPVIVPNGDGVKVLGPGYHPENGGTLVAGGELPPELPPDEAAAMLLATLDEFVFQCPGDKARAFAAIITPALKMGGFIRGFIPVDVREADQPQTGKGFSLHILRDIYRESAYPIALKSGGVGSLDESICSALISGKPFIAIDNVRGKLDSQFLEMVLTWGTHVAARIPHRGEVLVDPGAASFQLTSNGIEATPDFAKRASITRLLKQGPGFGFKRYPEGNLRDHIAANQPRYLGAVFALIRDWCRRGRPITNATGHDFREWAGILDAFAVYYMGENLLTGHEQAQERTANPALSWLRAVGLLAIKANKAGQELRAHEIYELSADDQLAVPGLRRADDDQGPKVAGRVLAKCFRESPRVELDHIAVTRTELMEYDPLARKDVPRKTYRFEDLRSVRSVRSEP